MAHAASAAYNIATVYYGVNGQYNSKSGVVASTACNAAAFGDPFPGLAKSCSYVITGQVTINTMALVSKAAQDGWVLEFGETTGLGGLVSSAAATFALGDNAANKQYRSILSFVTAALPDNAVIASATLKLRKAAQVGANPFKSLGDIAIDIRKGPFSGNAALQTSDFQASANRIAALTISDDPVNGWYSGELSSSSFANINLIGLTQFRLRFVRDDNNNAAADFFTFYSGDFTTTPAYRPMLVVNYYVP